MSEQIDELVENLKRPSLWKRVFFTLGFALLFNIILVPLVLLMVLVQVAFSLFAGEKNRNLADLSEKLVAYLVEVLGFLLFTTEHKPFPFNDFPGSGEINPSAEDVVESEIARSESAGTACDCLVGLFSKRSGNFGKRIRKKWAGRCC